MVVTGNSSQCMDQQVLEVASLRFQQLQEVEMLEGTMWEELQLVTQILPSCHFYGHFVAEMRKTTQKSHFLVSVSDDKLIVSVLSQMIGRDVLI